MNELAAALEKLKAAADHFVVASHILPVNEALLAAKTTNLETAALNYACVMLSLGET